MLVDFAKDNHGNLSTEETQKLIAQSHAGDLSSIMPDYEQSIKKPIKNTLFGSMIRLILIQVHKQKIDVERTMVAVDRLLRSNELNFQLIAAVPAVLAVVFVYFQFFLLFTRKTKKVNSASMKMINHLMNVERTINSHHHHLLHPSAVESLGRLTASGSGATEGSRERYEEEGKVVMQINKMCEMCNYLPIREKEKKRFVEDLVDLANPFSFPQQRINTINRIYRHYSFLSMQHNKH
eukprot:TRINITY_DN6217_c0_g1_i1.p1 TRINITY_DN6217_c0_g1~~TRINITY_DN6217_c0_g1_i1.p1  ORF type:complete len:237 (-),score=60.70 TRINITY_DN6217_c0_g1_i1:57-767(-)